MPNISKKYTTHEWTASRSAIVDSGYFGSRRHLIHAIIEVDVTRVRSYMNAKKNEVVDGEKSPLSFTGYIVKCLADTVAKHPMAHAYRNFWGNKLITFDSVDVVTLIETEKDGVALPHIIRNANQKSFEEISAEIRAVQLQPSESDQERGIRKYGVHMPTCLRRLFFRIVLSKPLWIQKFMGTTVVSSVGMFGTGGGWGIGFLPFHTTGVFCGGIAKKPAFVGDKVEAREYVSITLTFDHDIMDGAPAARFTNTFRELMENFSGCVDC